MAIETKWMIEKRNGHKINEKGKEKRMGDENKNRNNLLIWIKEMENEII